MTIPAVSLPCWAWALLPVAVIAAIGGAAFIGLAIVAAKVDPNPHQGERY